MPDYRRAWHPGGTYFFTVNLLQRQEKGKTGKTGTDRSFAAKIQWPMIASLKSRGGEENSRSKMMALRTPEWAKKIFSDKRNHVISLYSLSIFLWIDFAVACKKHGCNAHTMCR